MTIEQIIINIQNKKRERKIEPVHASFLEIQQEVKLELNRLVKENKLKFGKTLNDIYFEINEKQED